MCCLGSRPAAPTPQATRRPPGGSPRHGGGAARLPARPFPRPLPLWRQGAKASGGMSAQRPGHVNGYGSGASCPARPRGWRPGGGESEGPPGRAGRFRGSCARFSAGEPRGQAAGRCGGLGVSRKRLRLGAVGGSRGEAGCWYSVSLLGGEGLFPAFSQKSAPQ